MSECPRPVPACLNAADELNQQIRALLARADGRMTTEQRREYQRLVVAWAAASRGDVVAAA